MRHSPVRPIMVLSLLLAGAVATGAEPKVNVLAPGFRARTLPVKVSNVNGLAFAPDGTLYALAYDGRILRIVDSDGDGVEDKAEVFWDKKTLISPIAAVWTPEGLYVSSHLKVSLLKDDNKDGRADREEVVAEGWPQVPSATGLIDAMGIALDRDGNLFIGLACTNWAEPYLIKDGKAHYDPRAELGGVLKVSPDRKRREVFASGMRFPYALRFNASGDLFATDQEGETWLPGANPLDELDQIVPSRHYGWPPRHETHLPQIRDEPPVIGFGPQHQSACGLAFDGMPEGSKVFGPNLWAGNALVAGFSRGKVWRVPLVKTPAGYVGRPIVLASSDLMALDVAVSPKTGDLYLTCHSGAPDWGTGPKGDGTLFRISYEDAKAPQPVIAWPEGPLEVRVGFDRPVDRGVLNSLVGVSIPFGEYVRAADHLEGFRPPYKAVEKQQATARGKLRVAAARLSDDGRTLILSTDPHPREATFALTLPGIRPARSDGPGATVDLDYNLSGVEATWDDDAADAKPAWSGWWPHLDPDVVKGWAGGSAEQDQALALLSKPGHLALRTLVKLPGGMATLVLSSDAPFQANLGGTASNSAEVGMAHRAALTSESTGEAIELFVDAKTGMNGKSLSLHASYHTPDDPTERPLPLGRLEVPWAPAAPPASEATVTTPSQLAGGDPKRGEAVFNSDEAKCASCHKIRGKGGEVGPDLSNLVHRDAASVYRDISEPSATINPDYVPYTVALKDGQVLAGVVRAEGADAIKVMDTNAKATVVKRSDIEELRPSATSIMPVGLVGVLGDAKMRDLIAYLTGG